MNRLEVLRLGELDPENDIIILHVDVGKMPPQQVESFLLNYKKSEFVQQITSKGFKIVIHAAREGKKLLEIEKTLIEELQTTRHLQQNKTDGDADPTTAYEEAMTVIG